MGTKTQDGPKHTPVPWERAKSVRLFIRAARSGDPVADVRRELAPTYNLSQGELDAIADANAKFIVRACNAHDDLLAALQLCDTALEHVAHGMVVSGLPELQSRVAEALAKAEARGNDNRPVKDATVALHR